MLHEKKIIGVFLPIFFFISVPFLPFIDSIVYIQNIAASEHFLQGGFLVLAYGTYLLDILQVCRVNCLLIESRVNDREKG